MAAILDEHQSWQDVGGRPLTDGELYIGIAGSDPVANPKAIFSDSNLTTPAANPQPLDALGKTTVKIYTDGEYSYQANDVNGVQIDQGLQAGTAADDVPIIGLTNVSGGDTIVASGGITAYVDKAIYSLTVAQVNTGPVTLNIDSVGAVSVFKNLDVELDGGDWQEDQNVNVQYNGTSDTFHWIDQTINLLESGGAMTGTLSLAKGADVASAASLILGTDGNYFDITGTTAITSIGAIGVGTVVRLHFDDALTLTHNATDLVLPGSANITTAAGDEAVFVEYAAGDWRCTNYSRADGTPLAPNIIFTLLYESPEQTITPAGQLILAHGLGVVPKIIQAQLICKITQGNYAVDDIVETTTTENNDVSSVARGVSIVSDDTNLTIRYGSATNVFLLIDKSTGARVYLTSANWRFLVKAYA